jgi:hypothetical protein
MIPKEISAHALSSLRNMSTIPTPLQAFQHRIHFWLTRITGTQIFQLI